MNNFDLSIISLFNQFAQRSYTFDQIVIFISNSAIFKGSIFSLFLWWFWFCHKKEPLGESNKTRTDVILVIAACALSIFAARFLAAQTPFKTRPIHNPEINFIVPHDMDVEILQTWSSFPSDHASMFFAMAISFSFISNTLGISMLLYAFIFICLPRIYLGLHYPTDIAAGALIGIAAAYLTRIWFIPKTINIFSTKWLGFHPASFYAFFFLVTFQIAVMFDDLRDVSKFILHLLDVTVKFIK